MKRGLLTATALIAGICAASAQSHPDGTLTGSLESNTSFYQEDSRGGITKPDDAIGTNNYLKIDYFKRNIHAGAQLEGYLPAALGHPSELNGMRPTSYFLEFADGGFSFTGGTFYEQLGSGLLFRSWEDRALGINNALLGARLAWQYGNFLKVKAFVGTPRFGMGYSTGMMVRAADASFSISDLLGWDYTNLALEASVLDKYREAPMNLTDVGYKPNQTGWSARALFERGGYYLRGEWVSSGQKPFLNPYYGTESADRYTLKDGRAILVETGYTRGSLGVDISLRSLSWMNTDILQDNSSTANILNYVPALTAQYSYMLLNLHPHTPQTGMVLGTSGDFDMIAGELGAQIDVYYNFRRGTALGGRRGMKLHANYSDWRSHGRSGFNLTLNLLSRMFNLDVEKSFSKQFKALFLYSMQQYNPSYGFSPDTWLSNIFVLDATYRWNSSLSTRAELQYLSSADDAKDWVAGLLEVGFAPKWSLFCSDMYNSGAPDGLNYYNFGAAYTQSRTRLSLSYGRNRAGYICSGGVCRIMPAYTGATFSLITSF